MTAPAAKVNVRDPRLDLFRGLALFLILYEHAFYWATEHEMSAFFQITPYFWGLTCGASIFVFISGRAFGLAYGRTYDRMGFGALFQRSAKRVAQLYFANLATFLCVWALYRWEFPMHSAGGYVAGTMHAMLERESSWHLMLEFMRFGFQPPYFDILPLYMVLVGVAPFFVAGLARCPRATVAVSGLTYFAAQFGAELPLRRLGMADFLLNPLAWQLLFVLGLATARVRLEVRRSAWLATLSLMALTAVSVRCWVLPRLVHHRLLPPQDWFYEFPEWLERTNLPYFRLGYFVVLAYVIWYLLPTTGRLWEVIPVRALMSLGRQSLPVFCVGVVYSYTVSPLVMSETGSIGLLFVAFAAGVSLSLLAAEIATRLKRRKPATMFAASPPVPGSTSVRSVD